MLEHWMLDPECTYLNHGTVGATPRRVLQKQQALRDEMERQPSRFMLRELGGHMPMPWRSISRLREASDQVAAFVGCAPDDLVFVPNVTTGLNAVLQSLPLGPGDEMVITDLAYGAVAIAAACRLRVERRDASDRAHRVSNPRFGRGRRSDRQGDHAAHEARGRRSRDRTDGARAAGREHCGRVPCARRSRPG